jgi:hypothetical protein
MNAVSRIVFVDQYRGQRNAFVKKIGEDGLVGAFGKVVEDLKSFVTPVFRSILRDDEFAAHWSTRKGWAAS